MDPDELVRLSFWYPRLRGYTIPSASFECNDSFRGSLARLFLKAFEGDPFALAESFLGRHEGFRDFLVERIGLWGGVFVRGDRVSPKDACYELSGLYDNPFRYGFAPLPNTHSNACIALSPVSALALLISSERVFNLDDLRLFRLGMR